MSDNRITSVRIIYNQHNIDSALATAYLCTVLRKTDDHFFGNKDDCVALKIQTQHYHGGRHTPIAGNVDVLYVIGVTLLGSDLLGEIDACSPKEVIEYHYKQSEVKFIGSDACKYQEITPSNIGGVEAQSSDEISEASVSVLVAAHLETLWTKSSVFKTDEIKRLISSASRYINFKRFDRYFKFDGVSEVDNSNVTPINHGESSVEDFAYLHRHFNRIKHSAANAQVLELVDDYEFDAKHYTGRIAVARNIIHRNMSQATYIHKTHYAVIPTVCVGEESAIEVMRQMSYPYETVITYEDVRNQRVWRIYTAKPGQVMDLLRLCITPTIEWSEGQVHYMITEVPAINKT